MNDILAFINKKVFYYVKTFRLYEPLFVAALLIGALTSSFLTTTLQKLAIEAFGNKNFVPLISAELIGFFLWLFLANTFRNILTFFDTQILRIISMRTQEYSIDFTDNNASNLFSRDWISQGNLYFKNGLTVTDTHSGILLKPSFLWLGKVWLNFEATMKVYFKNSISLDTVRNKENGEWVKFDKNIMRNLLGVIIRAQSLDDYYMLEIWKIGNNIVLKPHVRISGVWRAPIYTSPIVQKIRMSQSHFKLKLVASDRVVRLFVNNSKRPLIWILPSQYEIDPAKKDADLKDGLVRKISFVNRAGMFGFRNFGNELAVVQNLKIKAT